MYYNKKYKNKSLNIKNQKGGLIINDIKWNGNYNTTKIEDIDNIYTGCFIGKYKKGEDSDMNGQWIGIWKEKNFYGRFIDVNEKINYINIINGEWKVSRKKLTIEGKFECDGNNIIDNNIINVYKENIYHGINNPRNFCYINTAIQLLYNISDIKKIILGLYINQIYNEQYIQNIFNEIIKTYYYIYKLDSKIKEKEEEKKELTNKIIIKKVILCIYSIYNIFKLYTNSNNNTIDVTKYTKYIASFLITDSRNDFNILYSSGDYYNQTISIQLDSYDALILIIEYLDIYLKKYYSNCVKLNNIYINEEKYYICYNEFENKKNDKNFKDFIDGKFELNGLPYDPKIKKEIPEDPKTSIIFKLPAIIGDTTMKVPLLNKLLELIYFNKDMIVDKKYLKEQKYIDKCGSQDIDGEKQSKYMVDGIKYIFNDYITIRYGREVYNDKGNQIILPYKLQLELNIIINNKQYELITYVVKSGGVGGGHYIIYKKINNGKWIYISDSYTKEEKYPTDFENAYIVCYKIIK